MVTFLGVETSRVSDALRQHIDIPDGVGLTIHHVAKGSGAEEAGLQEYDILLKVDDQIIINQEQLSTYIRSKKAGDKVRTEILRKGEVLRVPVKLGEREASRFQTFRRDWNFPTPPMPPKPDSEDGTGWNFNFNLKEFQKNMKEFQEQAAEMGNKALYYIPEIIIESETDDGGKRITTFGRGQRKAIISTDTLVAKMESVDGEKRYSVRKKDAAEGEYLYEGPEPGEAEMATLPEEVQAILKRLQSTKAFNWESMDDIKKDKIRVIINTGEEEARGPNPEPHKNEV